MCWFTQRLRVLFREGERERFSNSKNKVHIKQEHNTEGGTGFIEPPIYIDEPQTRSQQKKAPNIPLKSKDLYICGQYQWIIRHDSSGSLKQSQVFICIITY